MSRTERASERRSENRPALQLQRRYARTKRDPPSRRAGVKRRKLPLASFVKEELLNGVYRRLHFKNTLLNGRAASV
jgi:hypothetical protein